MPNLNLWPFLAALLVGVMMGTTAGGFGYRQFIEPGNIETAVASAERERDLVCSVTQYAAARAAGVEMVERERRARASGEAAFALQASLDAAARVAAIDALTKRNADYEKRIATEGGSCEFSGAHIDLLFPPVE